MQQASTQSIYARISIQVTVDHAEHQGEVGSWGVTKKFPMLQEKLHFGSFVCIDICGHDCHGDSYV